MKIKWQNILVIGFLAVSITFILWLTLLSRLGSYTRQFVFPLSSYKAVINGSGKALLEIIGNILLFIPVGMMFSLIFKLNLKRCIILGFAFSLLIECCQWYFWLGTFEIDDLIHNTVGAVLGYFLVAKTALGIKLELENRKKGIISLLCLIVLFTSVYLGFYGFKLNEMQRLAALNDLEDGRKNLLVLSPKFSYIGNADVNITCNSDGSVLIEGSSANRAWIHIGSMKLKPGKYILTGMPELEENTIALVLDTYDNDEGYSHRITQDVGVVNESEFIVYKESEIRALISIYPGEAYKVTARPSVYKSNQV